ncbi:RES family NAD+ phosphorylase [Mucilaginibacter ginsenosidivorax]|uniref:RES domain-containing protein n=1 Tax=Mucilaginibacter ginsenosidivorax TaxID=862126 RepID=A0A5B8VVS1_9SPHI|nr:RES family NAD+ phosphorylase [Mucilaginibacter ginsenosidivorax]QEC75519.1 RES domain-containing protein [Mucilaginibacter ginsenosidivorax]
MILYRISNCNYAGDLSGTGARLYGGRWNSEGKSMLYMASSRALAVLEVLVHLPPLLVPDNFCLVEIEIPEDNIYTLAPALLPINWRDIPPPVILRQLGDDFLKKCEFLVMKVPSSIVPAEYNYLLNPLHPEALKAKVTNRESFSFDERLLN